VRIEGDHWGGRRFDEVSDVGVGVALPKPPHGGCRKYHVADLAEPYDENSELATWRLGDLAS
jgi:hypothetical protein